MRFKVIQEQNLEARCHTAEWEASKGCGGGAFPFVVCERGSIMKLPAPSLLIMRKNERFSAAEVHCIHDDESIFHCYCRCSLHFDTSTTIIIVVRTLCNV